ncbi:MAG: glycosyltransferase family 2 protein [Thermoplasmatales archaeon]
MITYIIPAMNEEATIGGVIDSIREIDKEGEIIVVDSDSTDRTAEIARSRGAIVVNEKIKGYGYAYKRGFMAAKGDIICTLDGDGTYPGSNIPLLLDALKKGADFVSGERLSGVSKEAMSSMHMVGNIILNLVCRVLFMVDIKDSQSGMWLFKREVLPKILPVGTGMEFSEEIKIRAAVQFCYVEIPITYQRRMGEKKLKPWKDGIRNLLFLFKLRAISGLRTSRFRCSLF